MPTLRKSTLIALSLSALLTSGAGVAAETPAQEADAYLLAAEGALSLHQNPDEALRLMSRAAELARDHPDLAWLHIQACRIVDTCDPEPVEARLRSLDQRNGAGWLEALHRASRRGDEPARAEALAAIARSERVDLYWTALVAGMSRQVATTGTQTLYDAQVVVIGALAAIAIPAYQDLSSTCKGDGLRLEQVIQVCRSVGRALMNGDTWITERVGISITQRAWPEGSPAWNRAAEARRIGDYQIQLAGQHMEWIASHADEHLDLHARHRREQDVFREILVAAGRNPLPSN